MTIGNVSTVFGIQINKIDLLKIIFGDEEWKSEIYKQSGGEDNPSIEDIEEYEKHLDAETINEDLFENIEEFFLETILEKSFQDVTPYFFRGGRHEHDESELVLGIELFDSSVGGPGSTSSFSMEDFDLYQKKISACKKTIETLIGKDEKFDMFSVANDCQCCS